MHAMVGDLLEYARIGNEEILNGDVDTNLEMQHVLENLSSLITERNAKISYDDLPSFKGNPVQIMRLLQNLVGNAIKFSAFDVVPIVHVSAEDEQSHWRFDVRDNGIGIAPEYAKQIFEPFRQLHGRAEYKGTGIGLAICKRIVEKHGGIIGVHSALGSGSVFFFTIPK